MIVALVATLPLVGPGKEFDGLNNLLQIPFAMPWFLVPIASSDHVVDAWIVAGLGLLNAGLLYWWLSKRCEPAGPSEPA